MSAMIRLEGERFGRLTVLHDTGKRYVKHPLWMCRCDCGNVCEVTGQNLRRGMTQSCGCLAIEQATKRVYRHGRYGTKEYRAWSAMHTRCYNPNCDRYHRYGEIGIKVCDRWRDFGLFFEDIGLAPSRSHSVERKNGKGDYEPGNCIWATAVEQANNTSRNRRLSLEGKTQNLNQWAKEIGINAGTIANRIDVLRWPVSKALKTPLRGQQ
jgi:hypothetical protein